MLNLLLTNQWSLLLNIGNNNHILGFLFWFILFYYFFAYSWNIETDILIYGFMLKMAHWQAWLLVMLGMIKYDIFYLQYSLLRYKHGQALNIVFVGYEQKVGWSFSFHRERSWGKVVGQQVKWPHLLSATHIWATHCLPGVVLQRCKCTLYFLRIHLGKQQMMIHILSSSQQGHS